MTSPAPQRPFWKRKRWIAAAVLWLVAAYFISAGPTVYAVRCGWLSMPVAEFAYAPLNDAMNEIPGVDPAFGWYLRWWWGLPLPDSL